MRNELKGSASNPYVIDDNPTEYILAKKRLAKRYTEGLVHLFKAKKIYRELRKLKIDDGFLKYDLEIDYALFLKAKCKFQKSEAVLRKTLEALERKILETLEESTLFPSLLARCSHYLGEHCIHEMEERYTYLRQNLAKSAQMSGLTKCRECKKVVLRPFSTNYRYTGILKIPH